MKWLARGLDKKPQWDGKTFFYAPYVHLSDVVEDVYWLSPFQHVELLYPVYPFLDKPQNLLKVFPLQLLVFRPDELHVVAEQVGIEPDVG
jgi:hypothetical protein